MLSFKAVTSSGGASEYFENTDDYYAKDDGHKGVWQGEGAKKLELEGKVDKNDFKKLLDGYLTTTGEKIRKHKTSNNKDRKGIDFTLSAPKSVSIQALVNGDERVLRAHDEAVKSTMEAMEKLAVARRKEKGMSFREHTNNLVIASFRHELSREQDPQLHTHNIVMNLTQREDGEWRALSNEEMLKNVKVLGAFYKAELAERVKDLGYDLRDTKQGWELAHVDDKAIKLFSKRSNEIEKILKADGDNRDNVSGKYKQIIALGTRKKKTEEDRLVLHQEWVRSAEEAKVKYKPEKTIKGMLYKQYGEAEKTIKEKVMGISRKEQELKARSESAYKSVLFAVDHLSERQGIIDKKDLLQVAYEHGGSTSTTDEINVALNHAKRNEVIFSEVPLYQSARSMSEGVRKSAGKNSGFKVNDEYEKMTFNSWVALSVEQKGITREEAESSVKDAIKRGVIVKTDERFVTKDAKQKELNILAIEKVGRGAVQPISNSESVKKMLSGSDLNNGQREAVDLILTSNNRYIGIQGTAGTGKSHMLSKVVKEIEKESSKDNGNEYQVIGLAPYNSQVKALGELGMESKTLASFLANKRSHGQLNDKSLLILDEASVVPAKDMLSLMRIVERADARLVLNGDIKQTQAVEAGKPFEQLQAQGMSLAYLTEIKRQKNTKIKEAVKEAANDNIHKSVKILSDDIVDIKDNAKRYDSIASKYAGYTDAERKETLIVAGTNEARAEINLAVREKLNIKGGEWVEVLSGVDMTRAQASEARNYHEGMSIVVASTHKKLKAHEEYKVNKVDLNKNEISVADSKGQKIKINPKEVAGIRAYEKERIQLQKDEWVKVTATNKELGFNNGERYQVKSFDKDSLTISSKNKDIKLDKSKALHLQYGYATTVHSAQGMTNDRVLINADVNSTTSNKAVYYVAISRPRHGLTIYTNDKARLADSMNRETKKYAALEMRDSYQEKKILDSRLAKSQLKKKLRPQKPLQPEVNMDNTKTMGKGKQATLD